jgi:hypothetical protein
MGQYCETISLDHCNRILSRLVGLPITRPWLGIGNTLFLELGRISREERERPSGGKYVVRKGRACIWIEPDWRVEGPRSIQFGTGFSDRIIENRLSSFKGARIERIIVEGAVPEITVWLDDGRHVRSFCDWTSQSRWRVGFDDLTLIDLSEEWEGVDVSPYIGVHSGRLSIAHCYDHEKHVRPTNR